MVNNIKSFSKEDFNNDEVVIDFRREFIFDKLVTTDCVFFISDEEDRNLLSDFKVIDNYRVLIKGNPFNGYIEYSSNSRVNNLMK